MGELKQYKGQVSFRSTGKPKGFPPSEVTVMARSKVEAREKIRECNPGGYVSLRPNQ